MMHIWHWILDFLGVNNTYDSFSTHMYNFWSGFGGGLVQFSLLGVLLAIYHRSATRLKSIETTIRKPIEKIETRMVDKHDKPE